MKVFPNPANHNLLTAYTPKLQCVEFDWYLGLISLYENEEDRLGTPVAGVPLANVIAALWDFAIEDTP